MDDELASLRAEVASLRLTLGGKTFSADIPEPIGCPMPGACAQVAEIGRLRKDYGKEVAPIISDVLLMGRGVYDTPLAMANALIKRLRLKGYGIRKNK